MSKQELVILGQDATDDACCPGTLAAPLGEEQAAGLAKTFKALGDPVRLRLLSMIASRAGGEVCVCDLTPAFDLSQPTISHHLKLLRQAGLIDCERRGTWVYYRALPETLDHLATFLQTSQTSQTSQIAQTSQASRTPHASQTSHTAEATA
ncbi:metalloregulator ArsR/SmtB family transcription factor [Streptomyces sp. NBC_01485]|uniref:ArsR/SmtB family transcription factor n=1 Tax=Streptomyces sp. NBC_01485 TaxID=2903884 RepID=UPI002E2FB3E5|nr:metalloregulator ArsR/SmtB family transcription factor [Streptomyces sp. NBC_01485]